MRAATVAALVAASLVGCSEPPPKPPDWVSLGEDDENVAYFADRSSIGRPGAYARITTRQQPVVGASMLITFFVACDERRLAVRYTKRSDEERGRGVPEESMRFELPPPGSIGDAIVTEACRAT